MKKAFFEIFLCENIQHHSVCYSGMERMYVLVSRPLAYVTRIELFVKVRLGLSDSDRVICESATRVE